MSVVGTGRRAVPLADRYDAADCGVLTAAERARFLAPGAWEEGGGDRLPPGLQWQLLYRLEPELYDRLARAERLHPGVVGWLPGRVARAIEVGAGSGRLTVALARRCASLLAVEPAAGLRRLLRRRLAGRGLDHVGVRSGFVDAIPAPSASADLVVTASAFTPERAHGGDAGLAELERVAAPGGLVVIVWPNHLDWLRERGYRHLSFPGEMALEFTSLEEALELSAIFHPEAVDEIRRRGSHRVPYAVVGRNAPRDLAWRRLPG
ncbi:MAG TPA: methyltransferase domain-containing protein [Candidatus Dormibacteraeota bacterium]|jgi:SAM-dependent methyltransferase